PGYLTVKIAPERTEFAQGDGTEVHYPQTRKAWTPRNFKIEIDQLNCGSVSRIKEFTAERAIGAAVLHLPSLVVTIPESHIATWWKWLEDSRGKSDERQGRITFLDQENRSEVARLDFVNLGIFQIEAPKTETGSDWPPGLLASLYCESMRFALSSG